VFVIPFVAHNEDLPALIAWAIFNRFLSREIYAFDMGSAKLYHSLQVLCSYTTGMELVEKLRLQHILRSIDEIDGGLVECSKAVNGVFEDTEREDFKEALALLDQAEGQCLNRQSFKAHLEWITSQALKKIQPLLGDRNAGYFTCQNFEGSFPWQRKEVVSDRVFQKPQ